MTVLSPPHPRSPPVNPRATKRARRISSHHSFMSSTSNITPSRPRKRSYQVFTSPSANSRKRRRQSFNTSTQSTKRARFAPPPPDVCMSEAEPVRKRRAPPRPTRAVLRDLSARPLPPALVATVLRRAAASRAAAATTSSSHSTATTTTTATTTATTTQPHTEMPQTPLQTPGATPSSARRRRRGVYAPALDDEDDDADRLESVDVGRHNAAWGALADILAEEAHAEVVVEEDIDVVDATAPDASTAQAGHNGDAGDTPKLDAALLPDGRIAVRVVYPDATAVNVVLNVHA